MLALAKIALLAIVVWFFISAKNHQQSPIQWAIIGFIGYALTWGITKLTLVDALLPTFSKTFASNFLVVQIPALCAIAVSYFVRKKLLASLDKEAS